MDPRVEDMQVVVPPRGLSSASREHYSPLETNWRRTYPRRIGFVPCNTVRVPHVRVGGFAEEKWRGILIEGTVAVAGLVSSDAGG